MTTQQENNLYNQWRRDVSFLYVAITGRAYPSIHEAQRSKIIARLVSLWDSRFNDSDEVMGVDPFDALDVLITEGLLKS